MASIRTQVVLNRIGGVNEDVITNTWHWEDDSGGGLEADFEDRLLGLENRIKTFYGWCFANLFSNLLTGSGVIKFYNLTDLPDLFPIREAAIAIAPNTQDALPAECAIALSMNAARVAGVGQGRLRGRVFLGPIRKPIANWTTGRADVYVPDPTLTGLLTAAEVMATGNNGAFRLAVFSPTTYTATAGNLGASMNDVVRLSADDAFDVVRSRGADPTKRYEALIGGTNAVTLAA